MCFFAFKTLKAWDVVTPSALPSADSEYFRESIRHEIRMARERFSGRALSEELSNIQKRLDSVELLSPDIVMNLLLSYRDIQVRMEILIPACTCVSVSKERVIHVLLQTLILSLLINFSIIFLILWNYGNLSYSNSL